MTSRFSPTVLTQACRCRAPGTALALVIAFAAGFISDHYGAPAMLMALLIGMAFNFLSDDERFAPGINFAGKALLRLGVALLGARITVDQVSALGYEKFAGVAGLVVFTIAVGFLAARLTGRDWRFGLLTGGAVAICGASAALAISAALPTTKDTERDTLFTVIAVTGLSTVAMILYPVLVGWLGFNDLQAGFLIGATIHDVAQVVGAGYSISPDAGDTATLVKLIRVALLPVVVLVTLLVLSRCQGGDSKGRPTLPAFLIGFVVLAAINSMGWLPMPVADAAADTSRLLLVVAISAIGLKTSFKTVVDLGAAPLGSVIGVTLALLGAAIGFIFWLQVWNG